MINLAKSNFEDIYKSNVETICIFGLLNTI